MRENQLIENYLGRMKRTKQNIYVYRTKTSIAREFLCLHFCFVLQKQSEKEREKERERERASERARK